VSLDPRINDMLQNGSIKTSSTQHTGHHYTGEITLHHNRVHLRYIFSVSTKEVTVYPVFVSFFLFLFHIRTTTEMPVNNAELIRCGVSHAHLD